VNFCTQCGHPAQGSVRFCTNCGARQHPADDRTAPIPEDRGATPSGLDRAGPGMTAPITPGGASPGTEPPTFTAPVPPSRPAAAPAPPPHPAAPRTPPPPDLPAQTGTPYWPAGESPRPEPETPPGPWRRRFPLWLPFAAAVVVVLGGLAGWYLTGSHGRHPLASAGSSPSVNSPSGGGSAQAATAEASTAAPSPSGSPLSPTPAATATPGSPGTGGGGVVTLGPDVSGQPAAATIAAFLGQYFRAINDHDYQAYFSLFTPSGQHGLSQQAFNSGASTSADSGETLVALSPAQHGKTAATITFISHQSPAQSATKTACTVWRITLYLRPAGTSYLIGRPPGTYHASAKACA
jgi:hypothetical protein